MSTYLLPINTFTFLWDSWNNKVILVTDEKDSNEGNRFSPADWIPIHGLARAICRDFMGFSTLYQHIHMHPKLTVPPLQKRSGTNNLQNTALQPQPEGMEVDIPEDLQCGVCGDQVTVKFYNCAHAVCTTCAKEIWYSRVQHTRHFPAWVPCPFCRTEIHKVGMLSQQPQEAGFGDVVHYENTDFTVWSWQPVLRWMALGEEGVARGLNTLNSKRFWMFTVFPDGNLRMDPVTGFKRLQAVKMEDRDPRWAGLMVQSIVSMATYAFHMKAYLARMNHSHTPHPTSN